MIIDSIQNGIVIDHISAGKAMELYNILGLDRLDCVPLQKRRRCWYREWHSFIWAGQEW